MITDPEDVTCLECNKPLGLDWSNIPDCACDEEEYYCENCGFLNKIGYYAVIEHRN